MQEMQETWVLSLVQENALKEMATHFIFCATGRVTVTVNFMCNLTQPQDTRVFGETLFLGVSVRVFPDEISI